MKLTQFEPQVNLNIEQAKMQVSRDLNAYGGNTQGLSAMGKAIGAAGDIYFKEWQKKQNNDVIDALNEYNRRVDVLMNDENNGLRVTMQGKNAEGIEAAYKEEEEKIYHDIAEKYKLNTDYAYTAFSQKRETAVTDSLANINKYQREQADAYAGWQLSELAQNTQNKILTNPGQLSEEMDNWLSLSGAIFAGRGLDEAGISAKQREAMSTMATNTLTSLALTNEYTAGKSAVEYFRRHGTDEATLKKFSEIFETKKMAKSVKQSISEYVKTNNLNLTTTDFEEFYPGYKKANPYSFSGSDVKGFSTGNATYDQYDECFEKAKEAYGLSDHEVRILKSMVFQESSWNPNAYHDDNDGDPTLGLAQFKSDTARSAGLDPADRTDPEKSIMAMAKHYKDNLAYHGGSDELAILSHNGGAGGTEAARANNYLTNVNEKYNILYGTNWNQGEKAYSPEEIEQLEEEQKKAAKKEFLEIQKAQQAQIAGAINDASNAFSSMGTAYEKESYLKTMMAGNPLLASSFEGQALMRNIKAQQMQASGGGKTGSGGVCKRLISLIGTSILAEKDLQEGLAKLNDEGYALSDAEMAAVHSAWTDYKNGSKQYSIELPDKGRLSAYTGVEEKEFDNVTMGLIRQGIYEWNNNVNGDNPNMVPANQDVVMRIANKIVTRNNIYHKDAPMWGIFGGKDVDYSVSKAQTTRAGIKDMQAYGNGMWQIESNDGIQTWATSEQVEQIGMGTKTVLDVAEENRLVDKGVKK